MNTGLKPQPGHMYQGLLVVLYAAMCRHSLNPGRQEATFPAFVAEAVATEEAAFPAFTAQAAAGSEAAFPAFIAAAAKALHSPSLLW